MSALNGDAAASDHADNVDNMEGTIKLYREETETIAEAAAVAADNALDETEIFDENGATDEASILKGLTEGVHNQDDLRRDITYQANLVLIEQEDERDQKRVEKAMSN